MYNHIPVDRWLAYLSVALDLREQDEYKSYLLAGGDPKKFKWSSPDHAGTREEITLADKLAHGAKGLSRTEKRDIWEYGRLRGFQTIVRAERWEEGENGEKGKFLEYVWVDENGQEVDTSGYQVIETHHEGAKVVAQMVRERLH